MPRKDKEIKTAFSETSRPGDLPIDFKGA